MRWQEKKRKPGDKRTDQTENEQSRKPKEWKYKN